MDHQSYQSLSGGAVKLLLEFARQYKGKNNGDLTAAFSILKNRGFNSKDTIRRAIFELVSSRLIIETREGRFINPGGRCALYAITWKNIDECPGKELNEPPTNAPVVKYSMNHVKPPEPETGQGSDQKQVRQKQRDDNGRYSSVQKRVPLMVVT